MRQSRLAFLFLTLSLGGTQAIAQEGAIKADTEASKAAQRAVLTTPIADDTTASPGIAASKNLFAQNEPVEVARWDGGQFTNVEVSATLAVKQPAGIRTMPPEQFAVLSTSQQKEIIKNLVWERILLKQAQDSGINENTPEVAKAVALQEENLLNRTYYQNQIMPRLDELTVDAAREYYDKNKDSQFTRPAQTIIRALHVSTYEMVTAEEGDTIADIAKAVSGDAANAALIRQAASPFYLRQTPVEMQDDVLSSPLKGGEVLFVPRNAEAVSSATAFAETLRDQVAAGENLDKIVSENTDTDFPVTATQQILISSKAGYWDDLSAAAASLKTTTISQVIQTPAGLNILVLQDSETTQITPFAQVRDQLVGQVTGDENMRRQTVEETRKEILTELWKKYNVKLNETAINRPNYMGPDPLSTSTVIASAGDFQYTLEQFVSDLRMTGKDWGQLTSEQRLEVAQVAPLITNYVIARDARAMGLDNDEEFQKIIKHIAESAIVALYQKNIQNPEDNRVTDAELRAYYNDHIDAYTSSAQVTLRELSKRINITLSPAAKAEAVEEARKSLTEIRSRIKNEEDFAQLARRESEAISTRSRGGVIGTVSEDFRGAAFKNQVRQVKEGEVSEPFLYGSEVMIIRIDDRLPPTAQPFEQVKRQVMKDYARTEHQYKKNQEREKALEAKNFKFLF